MDVSQLRRHSVIESVGQIRQIMKGGVSVEKLQQAKGIMLKLASKAGLFPRSDFPIPSEEQIDRTFLIHVEDNGEYGLYVNSSLPGQQSRPHDHGGAWAIVAAVEGAEEHKVYTVNPNKQESSEKPVIHSGTITVKPDTAISMMPDGIHSIHAISNAPLLHLHLYGMAYESQKQRKEYNLDSGEVQEFILEDLGFVEDAR